VVSMASKVALRVASSGDLRQTSVAEVRREEGHTSCDETPATPTLRLDGADNCFAEDPMEK